MSSTPQVKESRIDRAAARLEDAVARLDAVLAEAKPTNDAPEVNETVVRLEAENATLKGLNREAADRLADAIRRLEAVAGQVA